MSAAIASHLVALDFPRSGDLAKSAAENFSGVPSPMANSSPLVARRSLSGVASASHIRPLETGDQHSKSNSALGNEAAAPADAVKSLLSSLRITSAAAGVGIEKGKEVATDVEVPTFEDVVTSLPTRETVEIEKRTFKYETDWVDRIVEVPEIRTVEKIVEVPTYQEVIKTVSRKEVIPVTTEVIKYVTRLETKIIEEERRVPGERIEVPKIIDVVKEVIVPRYIDTNIPTVVAQTIAPIVTDDGDDCPIDVITYEPCLVPVDIYVAKPIPRTLVCDGKVSETLHEVEIPAPQYNSILREMNSDIASSKEVYRDLPFRAEVDDSIHFLGPQKSGSTGTQFVRSLSSGIPLPHLAHKRSGERQIHKQGSFSYVSLSSQNDDASGRRSRSLTGKCQPRTPSKGSSMEHFQTSGSGLVDRQGQRVVQMAPPSYRQNSRNGEGDGSLAARPADSALQAAQHTPSTPLHRTATSTATPPSQWTRQTSSALQPQPMPYQTPKRSSSTTPSSRDYSSQEFQPQSQHIRSSSITALGRGAVPNQPPHAATPGLVSGNSLRHTGSVASLDSAFIPGVNRGIRDASKSNRRQPTSLSQLSSSGTDGQHLRSTSASSSRQGERRNPSAPGFRQPHYNQGVRAPL